MKFFYSFAKKFLVLINQIVSDCKLYTLETVNILRKYTQILDLPISLLSSSYWYLISYQQRHYVHVSLHKHILEWSLIFFYFKNYLRLKMRMGVKKMFRVK